MSRIPIVLPLACFAFTCHNKANLLYHKGVHENCYDCIKEADALIILTEWDEFRALDMTRVKKSLKSPNIIDLRNIYNPQSMKEYGFNYISVGR